MVCLSCKFLASNTASIDGNDEIKYKEDAKCQPSGQRK